MQKDRIARTIGGLLAALFIAGNAAGVYAAEAREDEVYILPDQQGVTGATGATGAIGGLSKDISKSDLKEADHPPSSVIGLDLPNEKSPNDFVIRLGSSIGKVKKWLTSDNHLVLDFYNASEELEDQYYLTHPVVERVRVGTFDGGNARVVLDLKTAALYTVSLDDDRRALTVSFIHNNISGVDFHGEGNTDIVEITGDYPPAIEIRSTANANEVIFDIPFSKTGLTAKWMADLEYLQSVAVTQSDENTVRVSVVSRNTANYQIKTEGDTTYVYFTISTLKNISYGGDNTLRLQKDSAYPININQITVEDHYNTKQYILTMPGSFTDWLGLGNLPINDGYLRSVSVQEYEYRTQIIFFENRVLTFNITEDSQNIYVTAVLPREKYAKIVIIDPGHGGRDPGARANGLIEKDVTLDISARLMRLIDQDGEMKAYATRKTDVIMDLYDRPVWANDTGDLFVSIHMNASGNGNAEANGTEVYYYPHDNDGALGFSGEKLANILNRNLLNTLGSAERGVKSARFVVIRNTKIPAALIEVGFLTNPAEASKLATDTYRQTAAEAIYRSLREAFAQYSPPR